jgi:hypothetical protein
MKGFFILINIGEALTEGKKLIRRAITLRTTLNQILITSECIEISDFSVYMRAGSNLVLEFININI